MTGLTRLAFISSALVVSVVAVACTSGSSTSTSGGSGSGSGSSTDFINSYCGVVGQCCGTQGLPTDGASCRALLTLEEGAATYDANAGSSCLAAVMSVAAADSQWCAKSQTQLDSACSPVFKTASTGTVAPGGACSKDADCAAGPAGSKVVCNETFTANATTSACQVRLEGKAGDSPCIATEIVESNGDTVTENAFSSTDSDAGTPSQGYLCSQNSGVYCDGNSQKCTALIPIGQACTESIACAAGGFCNFTTQKCAAPLAVGASCTSGDTCVAGAYCDMTSNKCATSLADGSPCTTSQSCASGTCNNMKCGASQNIAVGLLCGSNN